MTLVTKYVSSLAPGGGNGTSGNPWSLSEALANAVAGNLCILKADGAYAITTNTSIIGAGTPGSPLIFVSENYGNITHNLDATLNITNLVTVNITSGQRLTLGTAYLSLIGINFVGAYSAASPVQMTSSKAGIVNCRFESTTNGSAYALQVNASSKLIGCDFVCSSTGTNSRIVQTTATNIEFDRCTFKGAGSTVNALFETGSDTNSISNSIFFPSAGIGISLTVNTGVNMKLENVTIVGQAVAAIQTPNAALTTQSLYVENCIITDNTYAFKSLYAATANHNFVSVKNMIGRNTNVDLGFGDCRHEYLVTPSATAAQDFANYAANDFRLVAGSPACSAGFTGEDLGGIKRPYVAPTYVNVTDLRSGVNRGDGQTGNLVVPSASNLLSGVGAGSNGTEVIGNVTQPVIGDVRLNTHFGPNNSLVGTLNVSSGDPTSYPPAKDTRLGVSYGGTLNLIGLLTKDNYDAPAPTYDTYPETIYLESSIGNVVSL